MIYLYGASGHAKVVLEVLEEQGVAVAGLFDDNAAVHSLWQYSVHRYTDEWKGKVSGMIIALGNNRIRKQVAEKLPVPFVTGVHPKAHMSGRAVVGEGSVVMAGATVNADAVIGEHCIINTNASIDHDCVIGDYVHVSPNATLCGGVTVGEGTHIGAGAVIKQGIVIGRWATIGAGSVVIRDVADNAIVVGNPAKEMPKKI